MESRHRDVKRLVFHLGGYEPVTPAAFHRRFRRGLDRFQKTWSATASMSELQLHEGEAFWRIVTSGPNWRAETDYRLIRWDDVIAAQSRQPAWRRVPLGLGAFFDFVAGGALRGYFRTNWRYAGFFLYPFLLFALFVAAAALIGTFIGHAVGVIAGILAAVATLAVLTRWPGHRFYLWLAFDDWIFAKAYIAGDAPVLDRRLDHFARELIDAVRSGAADEIAIVGHSLGAVLAVDVLDRAFRREPRLAEGKSRLVLLTVGSSILKIALHRRATAFRAALARVAAAPGLFWAEYQALTDVMNFCKTDPVTACGLPKTGSPFVRIVRFREMLDPASYRRLRRSFFRMHRQFVSGNERRAPYDFFMLTCGPLAFEWQVRSEFGAAPAIGPDGALLDAPERGPQERPACAVRS